MDNFIYCSPTRYIFGRGVENEAGAQMAALGVKNVMVCFGGGSVVRSGLLARVMASLEAHGITACQLGGIVPNPTDVANTEKKVPLEWINKEHNGVEQPFIDYVLPLIQGEPNLPKVDSLPRFAKLKKVLVK